MKTTPLNKNALRYVEKQSHIATSALVDNEAEQLRLEQLLEDNKHRLGEDLKNIHWLIRSAFRYPPLKYGSRFGTRVERGILYSSETLQALVAELAFYSYHFVDGFLDAIQKPVRREVSVIRLRFKSGACHDLSELPKKKLLPLIDPASWHESQELGARVRKEDIEVIRYPSARIDYPDSLKHCNLAVLTPAAVSTRGQPALVESFITLADVSGVRVQGGLSRTLYFPADRFSQSLFQN